MPADLDILFVSGLTGVGKSTTLAALENESLTLLPNRRALTDEIIIPWVQQSLGQEQKRVTDRLERFDLTCTYRETHPGGIVAALQEYLSTHPPDATERLVFDNVRGLDECRAALATFPKSRYIFLDAPPLTRLKRMLGRGDSFDQIKQVNTVRLENTTFVEQLMSLEGANEIFDSYELARLEANSDVADDKILDTAKIILKEQQNYSAEEAARFLKSELAAERLLYLDTSLLSIDEVVTAIGKWL